ncbi:hypothetical protein NQ317_018087 [Molorchus minor]|uniref:DDE Tnp4 domain-containing protein n=1 Tax=Molorchus minor TaxID=1323400 RepID=A0ABQ9JEU5_9CUCU|nr:hypothetical protein NQ317_018087 [Molorchus minor]
MRICSLHFKDEDYKGYSKGQWKSDLKSFYLKNDAVPSLNLPVLVVEDTSKRSLRLTNRNLLKSVVCAAPSGISTSNEDCIELPISEENIAPRPDEIEAAEILMEELQPKNRNFKFSEVAVQVNTSRMKTICELIDCDSKLNSLTGLPSLKLLDEIVIVVASKQIRTGFESTRIILDCTEIIIQKPKCLCCRIRCYCQYKLNNTIKFMTGVSPGGLITYVSKCYGGRTSDKAIFEQSGLIKQLEMSKDAIMVDKGFLIDKICEDYDIRLYRPPFLRAKNQLAREESRLNVAIASARVHVERANQRIKLFAILNSKMQWPLVSLSEDIFTIACAITNLSPPIIADDKFMA